MTSSPDSTTERPYVLGTEDEEIARLALQHDRWREQARAIWKRAGFGPGRTLLDLGCGPGFTSLDLARVVAPRGRVIAVDRSERFVAHLRERARSLGVARALETRLAMAEELDLPASSLDGAFTRWVLAWMREPERVLAAIARALRPGAAFAIQEYVDYGSMRVAPRSELFERVVAAIIESFRRSDADIDVGCRLPALLDEVGLCVTYVEPVARIARPGDPLWAWPDAFYRNYVPKVVERGLLAAADERAFFAEWDRRSRDPRSCWLAPTVVDVIAVKPRPIPRAARGATPGSRSKRAARSRRRPGPTAPRR
ncbi:MAG TPA: methyltransferase domain-containing protein [Planctomycetota bacterium]|nr:methyltransferase domain-containing protein [Planctomycetota bacterium]